MTPHQRRAGLVQTLIRLSPGMLVVLVCLCLPTTSFAESPDRLLIPSRYVAESGHNIGGPFLSFYDANAGATLFGLPITEVMEENQLKYQYFERARLEIRPEEPERVWVSPLGKLVAYRRQQEPAFARHDPGDETYSTYFSTTGHNLSYQFRPFWEQHGGYPVFGYPVSEAFTEYNALEGRTYTVQYFEKARLDYRLEHPGGAQIVRIGSMGRDYARIMGVSAEALAPSRPLMLLGTSTVHFGTSSGETENIRLAARQFDGLKMMPGEEVSFLALVGELTSDTGYVSGGAIVGGSIGQVIAGGICWVSTGVFQTVLSAGLEIVERHPHSIALNGFVEPPGLDSAVYSTDGRGVQSSGDVDLRWRNDLPEPVIMATEVITTGDLKVSLWGYQDGRSVTMSDPIIQTSAQPGAPTWRYNAALPPCEVLRITGGNPGMRITVERVVTGGDGVVLHKDSFSSRYAPLRGAYVYGPGVTPVQDGSANPDAVARERCLLSQHSQGASP